MIFIKIPHSWLSDAAFSQQLTDVASRSLGRTRSLVAIKYLFSRIEYLDDFRGGTITNERIGFNELTNANPCFNKLRARNWHMFPSTGPLTSSPAVNYNGMPTWWKRLIIIDDNAI